MARARTLKKLDIYRKRKVGRERKHSVGNSTRNKEVYSAQSAIPSVWSSVRRSPFVSLVFFPRCRCPFCCITYSYVCSSIRRCVFPLPRLFPPVSLSIILRCSLMLRVVYVRVCSPLRSAPPCAVPCRVVTSVSEGEHRGEAAEG